MGGGGQAMVVVEVKGSTWDELKHVYMCAYTYTHPHTHAHTPLSYDEL